MPTVREDAVEVLVAEDLELPLIEITHIEPPPHSLSLAGKEYVFERSVPVKGFSAILPKVAREIMGQGKELLIGRWGGRYYVYVEVPAS
jgi:hypothetical protein